ncbi:hypothetical protein AF335_16985 [Streptomyces eurocidicus]|uniref:Outer membrane protein assembly factor BamB n=1 Tax=Streptomyces eurocidicus TaxID=66423 RepID=A0A2N8NU67_STREU|nr:PQQ-binding-like beta-propeller repeat protein [Streptomyces eurocidicus]MBB5123229.1 outer membrane protein assembly factor BamB [Streptomyces eurocidicus]PNE32319.1 hypothetical protein AF335_16985 [Streptomyces eurocidicus]
MVKAQADEIVALDRRDGTRLWDAPTPGSGTVMCQASTDATSNIAVLAYGNGEDCHTFYAVDLTSGKPLWQHQIDADEWAPSGGTRIARSGDTVVVSAEKHLATAYRVSDGKELWKDTSPTAFDLKSPPGRLPGGRSTPAAAS